MYIISKAFKNLHFASLIWLLSLGLPVSKWQLYYYPTNVPVVNFWVITFISCKLQIFLKKHQSMDRNAFLMLPHKKGVYQELGKFKTCRAYIWTNLNTMIRYYEPKIKGLLLSVTFFVFDFFLLKPFQDGD